MTALNLSRKSGQTISGGNYSSINLSLCSDITLEGVTIELPFLDTTTVNSYALRLFQSPRVSIIDCTITGPIATSGIPQTSPAGTPNPGGNIIGLPTGTLLTADTSPDLLIRGTKISSGWRGIALNKAQGLIIEDCDIHDVRTTPIAGNVLGDALIQRNHSWHLVPWAFGGAGDHGDAIHLWTTPTQTDHTRGISIRHNLHEQDDGNPSLGVYLDTNTNPMGFADGEIFGQVLVNSNNQGMRLENCEDFNIGGNFLFASDPIPADVRQHPAILMRGRFSGDINGNRAKGVDWDMAPAGYIAGLAAANSFAPTQPGESAAAVAAWMARFR